jgi:hypothetical protein
MIDTNRLADVVADLRAKLSNQPYWTAPRDEALSAITERLKTASPDVAVNFAITSLRMVREEPHTAFTDVLNKAVGNALRRKLPFTEDQVTQMIELVSQPHREFPFKGILSAAESVGVTPRIADSLRRLRPCITEFLGGSESRNLHARIDLLLSGPAPATSLEAQGAWSRIVFQEMAASPHQAAWERIFVHAAELKSAEASKKWRAASREFMNTLGREVFFHAATRWLALGPSPGHPGVQISSGEADFQKGFLWFLADESDERLPRLLADFAEGALKKIPMLGAVSQKIGNACVNVLSELPGLEPVSQLGRLARRVRYDTAQRLIEEALTRAADKAGISREQLEEMNVSTCGLGPDGTLRKQFGDYIVDVSIDDATSVVVRWSDQGQPLKAAPADVKQRHAEEWKDLQRDMKDMEKLLSSHRIRIERLLLTQRPISIETLRSCYLDHPLLAGMSRRLVWQFDSGLGAWRDGRIVDNTDREIDLAAQTNAKLWSPASSDVQTVIDWRCWLEDRGIRQPFKQAHREVYLLTDAERQTATYSNRFAAHILRQHIFAALCEQRGWAFHLMGQWGSHNTPALELPQFGLRVEYDVDFPHDENEVSGHAIYLLIRTGAARFLDNNRMPLRLDAIPPTVFSEVMRDLDLFNGVASIGADPAWGLRASAPFQKNWESFSSSELTEMAGSRRSLLERMLPSLSIRDRCKLDDRYLSVRGDRATYRIHLGSANVLMEPGSRYMSLVEGAATAATPRSLPLPFEGDRILSLILSKTFLLAGDRKIKDEAILRQLRSLPA